MHIISRSPIMELNLDKDKLLTPDCNLLAKKLRNTGAFKTEQAKLALSTFLTNYKDRFNSINDIVHQDFNNGQKISINNHVLDLKSQEALNTYISSLNIMNVNKFVCAELNTIINSIMENKTNKVSKTIMDWHNNHLLSWDNTLESVLLDQINIKHKEKCSKQFGIYNFTAHIIPDEDYDLLKNGKKVVIPSFMSSNQKLKRIKTELHDYCARYRKYFENTKHEIPRNTSLEGWLSMAINTSSKQEAKEFYASVLKNINNLNKNLPKSAFNPYRNANKSSTILPARLDYPNFIWNEADKNRGISLFTVDQMKTAEKNCIKELGGTQYLGSKTDLEAAINNDIDIFVKDLDGQQKWLIHNMFGDLHVQLEETVVPFLNLKSKVHKLTSQEIQNKDFSRLTFRPIVDQSLWVLNKISKSFMALIVSVNEQLIDTEKLNIFESMLPKNGAEVANHFREFKFTNNTSIKSIISADLSNAYTNISLQDLETAIEKAGNILDMDSWKVELLISMSRVIIKNNYVQTSTGIYHLQDCLAMGNSSSGACLNLVGLTSEFHKISPPPSPHNKGPLQPSIYFRFLDDTKAIMECNDPSNMSASIINIGTMFPASIPINIDMFNVIGSFLDIITIRKLSTGTFETILKKNLSSPPAYIPFISAVPNHYKMSALKTEMIRIRRICSKNIFIWHMDKLLLRELAALGHKNGSHEMSTFKETINKDYDENFVKKKEDKEDDKTNRVYGATTKMETLGGTHIKVLNILSESLGNSEASLPMIVPTTKLKEILHTRRKYMTKLQCNK